MHVKTYDREGLFLGYARIDDACAVHKIDLVDLLAALDALGEMTTPLGITIKSLDAPNV